jgi:hypothetical protein
MSDNWRLRIQALLASVDDTPLGGVKPCYILKLAKSLKLRNACGLDGIPNECLTHIPRKSLVYLIYLFNYCLRLSCFQKPWKKEKIISFPKPGEDQKFPQSLSPISPLSTIGKLFEKVILKIVQRHFEERGLLIASQIGFRARHSTALQCMNEAYGPRGFNSNNNMSTAAVFLDIENFFDKIWHLGLLYKSSPIKLIASFSQKFQSLGRRRNICAKGHISRGATGSVLSLTLYSCRCNVRYVK